MKLLGVHMSKQMLSLYQSSCLWKPGDEHQSQGGIFSDHNKRIFDNKLAASYVKLTLALIAKTLLFNELTLIYWRFSFSF